MLKEKINQIFKKAFKAKEELKISALRLLQTTIKNKEIEKRTKLSKTEKLGDLAKLSELTDEEVIGVVFSEIKKRQEAILDYQKGARSDLAEKEQQEIVILEQFLPEQLSEEEVRQKVKEIIAKVGAAGPADFGRVMGAVMAELKGKTTGNVISQIVKEQLTRPDLARQATNN